MLNLSKIKYLLLVSVLLVVPARAAERCDCDSEVRDKIDAYDALLNLSSAKRETAKRRHLLGGLPASPSVATREHLLAQKDYLIWHDGDLRLPLWVSYRLTRSDLKTTRERLECFRRDPRLDSADAGACDDYQEPIFDRGHMAPNADMVRSEAAMLNTYMFSNMTPQHENFNSGIWSKLEAMVRDWARVHGKIYVITGAVFDKDNDGKRDADGEARRVNPTRRVAIATHFYKIVVRRPTSSQPQAIAILLPHDNEKHSGAEALPYLSQHITSIKHIESITGIAFFPDFTPSKRTALVNSQAAALWPTQ